MKKFSRHMLIYSIVYTLNLYFLMFCAAIIIGIIYSIIIWDFNYLGTNLCILVIFSILPAITIPTQCFIKPQIYEIELSRKTSYKDFKKQLDDKTAFELIVENEEEYAYGLYYRWIRQWYIYGYDYTKRKFDNEDFKLRVKKNIHAKAERRVKRKNNNTRVNIIFVDKINDNIKTNLIKKQDIIANGVYPSYTTNYNVIVYVCKKNCMFNRL